DRGAVAVGIYSALFGALPYACVDIVEAPLQRAAGVEFSGLFLVSGANAANPQDPFFDVIVSHEMAHQWFYAAVGNDPTEEPWLDEALATYASNVFLSVAVSAAAAQGERAAWAAVYDRAQQVRPDLRVTSPVYEFPDSGTYSAFVYSGGAFELDALRREIGDDAFFAGLADYYVSHTAGIARGADLSASFRHACECWPTSVLFDGDSAPAP
ncbi:MAG: M1 family aminopeptidase, partial [Candidatus Bipolaricaulota bacterium]|nr:M1 family aminopeptidase [Candidatus Bipolaricaulota bacterium]